MNDQGLVIQKDDVRKIIEALVATPRESFSEGQVGVEQAINRICALQKPPSDIQQIALTVTCPYCGYTPGNPCRRGDRSALPAHPSRIAAALHLNILGQEER